MKPRAASSSCCSCRSVRHGVAVDLDITSVALLTPDKTRHSLMMKETSKDERAMLRGQTEAWGAVERTGVSFRFNGREIRVRPHIVTFNVGVGGFVLIRPSALSDSAIPLVY